MDFRGMKARAVFVVLAVGLALQLGSVIAQAAPSATLPKGVTQGVSIEGVDEYRLANGLQVLLYPDNTKPTVTVNITYKVGSRMENYGETGMAHLLEHLMFKGSTGFPNPDKEFSARGFRNNGTTSFDRTNYFSTFAASDDNVRWALAREADAMVHSFIARKDLDTEMTVVRNEYESGENQPMSVLYKRLASVMFDWHNYGKQPIGARSDIENVDITHLQSFYRMYYQPDNAVLIVAGKFDVAKTLRWIAADFGPIPKPRRALPILWTVEPTQDGERSVIVRRKGDEQIVMLGYHIPAERSADNAGLDIATQILGDTPNGRLHHELVETGLASSIFAEQNSQFDPGTLIVGAVVKKGDSLEKARDRLIDVVETTFSQKPPTDEELDRVRRDEATLYERVLADPEEFGRTLSESISQGDWRLFFVDRNAAATVSGEAVAAAAGRYLRRDNRTVAMFIPEDLPQRAQIPAPLPVEAMLKDFQPRATVVAGEEFSPTPENIDARTRRVNVGDLKIALLPKKTKGATVNVAMSFEFGDEKTLQGKTVVRELAAAMIGRGTADMTRQQISNEMIRLKMNGGPMHFETDRENLVGALRLAAHVIQGANFPASEFDQLKRQTLTHLQAELSDPDALAFDALRKHLDTYPPGDPRHYLSVSERIEAINGLTVDDAKAFFDQFWGSARGQVAIVGDFDDVAAEHEIETLFSSWRSKAPFAHILREPRTVPAERIFLDTPDKENAVYRARALLDLRDDDPDAPALILANEILGGGSGLHSRLADRVRQKDGLSYGIASGLSIDGRDRAATWGIFAIAAPQNVNHVEADIREEIDRLRNSGFGKDEVRDAEDGLLQQRALARSDDAIVAAVWLSYLDLDRSFAFSRKMDDAIRALTPEQLTETVRRYLDPAKMTVVVAGDAHKGAK